MVGRIFRAVEEVDASNYLDRTYHPEILIRECPTLPYGGDYEGPEGVLRHARAFLETWGPHQGPGDRAMHPKIDAVPDHAYVRWSLGVAQRRFDFISHYGFRDGLIVESRMFPFDGAGLVAWWRALCEDTAGHRRETGAAGLHR